MDMIPACITKKTNDGYVTVRTHVDDLKISSKSVRQLQMVIDDLKNIYQEITVHKELSHDYLGMIMTHDHDKQCITIDMQKYILDCVSKFEEEFPEEKLKPVATPATNSLFKVRNDNAIKLSKERAKIFHSTVAKLLFVAKRARPDIILTVSFLTTRVKCPDSDDWKKLVQLLGYLKSTIPLCLTLSCVNLKDLTWYIDGSYATHEDMKGHSGAILMAGNCAVLFKSNKQKINTRSSTESELIVVDDILPTIQWTKNFLSE